MKVASLDGRQLRKLLRQDTARCVVLDCRPYLSFAASSVRGSLNVNLNSVVIRRARGGAVPLRFVVPDEAARARLLQEDGASGAAVIVLDQGTRHWQKLRKESTAHIVLGTLLSSLPAGPRICFLKGGYETFYSQYPECCVDVEPLSQDKTETERNLISHCEKQNMSRKPAYDQEKFRFLHLSVRLQVDPVEDNHTADISSHFQEAIDFIDCVRRTGGKILVHCEAGISRSPTICMAYLMKTKRFRLEEAFDYIKQRRSMISPNFGFMGQLLQYESEILSSMPNPQVASCKREAAAASFFADELTLSPGFEGSCYTFPTSVLTTVPIHSPVHQLKLSPITASSTC